MRALRTMRVGLVGGLYAHARSIVLALQWNVPSWRWLVLVGANWRWLVLEATLVVALERVIGLIEEFILR